MIAVEMTEVAETSEIKEETGKKIVEMIETEIVIVIEAGTITGRSLKVKTNLWIQWIQRLIQIVPEENGLMDWLQKAK